MSLHRLGTKRSRVFSSDDDDDDDEVAGIENASKRANVNSVRTSEDFRGLSSLNQTKTPDQRPLFESRVLEKTLRESGLEPDFSSEPTKYHVLTCDQAVFQKKVSKAMKQFLNPDDVETFSNEVIALLESSDEALMKALYPTKTSSACQSARSTGRDIYCLLCVAVHEQTILLLSIASLNHAAVLSTV